MARTEEHHPNDTNELGTFEVGVVPPTGEAPRRAQCRDRYQQQAGPSLGASHPSSLQLGLSGRPSAVPLWRFLYPKVKEKAIKASIARQHNV